MTAHQHSIAACARWETDCINEWISYHLHIGFDHIYLYCNDDDPRELYQTVLPFLIGRDPPVTFRHFPFQGRQWQMYMHFIVTYRHETEWVSFLDIDEFVCLKDADTIGEFASRFGPEIDSICFNWLKFGTSGHVTRPRGSVLLNYDRCDPLIGLETKVLVRSACLDPGWIIGHACPFWHGMGGPGFTYSPFCADMRTANVIGLPIEEFHPLDAEGPPRWHTDPAMNARIRDTAYIAHFFMKSQEDFMRRVKRGTEGDFGGQWTFAQAWEDGSFRAMIDAANASKETHLKDVWLRYIGRAASTSIVPVTDQANVALHKPAMQSSLSPWSRGETIQQNAAGAVSGLLTGGLQCHTDYEDAPWWQVDLLAVHDIREIRLFNRLDRAGDLRTFSLSVSDDGAAWREIFRTENAWPPIGYEGMPFILPLELPVPARFVRLTKLDPGYLHIDQVQVFGAPAETCAAPELAESEAAH